MSDLHLAKIIKGNLMKISSDYTTILLIDYENLFGVEGCGHYTWSFIEKKLGCNNSGKHCEAPLSLSLLKQKTLNL